MTSPVTSVGAGYGASVAPTLASMGAEAEVPSGSVSSAEGLALFAAMSIADSHLEAAQTSASEADRKRHQAVARARRALDAARAAARASAKSSGLASTMKSVAKWAGVAAVAGSAVATGGASVLAVPTLTVVLGSAVSMAMRSSGADTKVCTLYGVDINASDVILLGSAIAGFGCASDAAEGGDSFIAKAGAKVAFAAALTQGGATGAAAVETQRAGHFDAERVRHQARAREADFAARHALEQIQTAIGSMRESSEFRQRAFEAVTEMLRTKDAADAAMMRRRA